MDQGIILIYYGATFFYAYLSIRLPDQFAPLKMAYLVSSFFFIIAMFFYPAVAMTQADVYYTIPINVTYNGTLYQNVSATIIDRPYATKLIDLQMVYVYGNGIILGITVLFLVILIIKNMMEPVKETIEEMESRG